MNLTIGEGVALAQALSIEMKHHDVKCDVIICPPTLHITEVSNVVSGTVLKIGAQNCAATGNGAYTGEVSAAMLHSAGVHFVIVGHSERRDMFGDSNEVVASKMHQVLANNLSPIFCCGEPLAVRNQNKQEEHVLKQLQESLFQLSEEEIKKVIIAYEPVWAIGTGVNATTEQAQQMHAFIRRQLTAVYGSATANEIRILYGGSCKPDNAGELFKCPDVDGGLIGGASLKATDFLAIIDAA